MSSKDPFNVVRDYLLANKTITNREFRQLLNVPYDHAIILLGALCRLGLVQRHGVASSTYYKLVDTKPSLVSVAEFNSIYEKKRR
jgi:hypothetical protein